MLDKADKFGRVPLHHAFDPTAVDEGASMHRKKKMEKNNGENMEEDDDWNQALLDELRPVDQGGNLSLWQHRRNIGRQKELTSIVELLTTPDNLFHKNYYGKTPFRLFCRICSSSTDGFGSVAAGTSLSSISGLASVLKILLDCNPTTAQGGVLGELRHLLNDFLDLAIKYTLTHGVVNSKTTHSMYASNIFLDLLVQLALIIGFTIITARIKW
jgi:hypothetical protein